MIHSCVEDYLKKQNRQSFCKRQWPVEKFLALLTCLVARDSHLYERIDDNLIGAADEQYLNLDQAQNDQHHNFTTATKKFSGIYCIPNDDSHYPQSSVDNDPTQIMIKNF